MADRAVMVMMILSEWRRERTGRYEPDRPPVVCIGTGSSVCRKADARDHGDAYIRVMNWPTIARWALLAVVVVLLVSGQAQVWAEPEPDDVAPAATVLLITVPLVWARRWPLPVLLVVLAGAVLEYASDTGLGQVFFAVLLAVYGLGSWATRRASGVGMALVALGFLSVDLPRLQDGASIDEVVPAWFVFVGVWGLGRWMQHRAGRARRAPRAQRCPRAGSRGGRSRGRPPTNGRGSPVSSMTWWHTAWL